MLEFIQMRIPAKYKDLIGILVSLLYMPEIIILKFLSRKKFKNYDDIWIISERGIEAKDNGYHFFKYLKENNIKDNVYYIMDIKNERDYKKVKHIGNIVQYKSLQHKLLYINSKVLISTHMNTIIPWKYCRYNYFNKIYKNIIGDKKYIFLQHGIIRGDLSKSLCKKNADIDLFITSAKPEYEYVLQKFGYTKEEVVCTGLARFDNLHNIKIKKQILLMPSWRVHLRGLSDDEFKKSDYYIDYQSLITNKRLLEVLEKYDYNLIFYPHHEMQKYLHLYKVSNERIILADNNNYDVQELLKSSELLLTDYSSVYYDFAYMNKPLIYYHPEHDTKFKEGLKESYFNFSEHGFGVVAPNEVKLIDEIEKILENRCEVEDLYKLRSEKFFSVRDNQNCKRIYKEVSRILKEC